MKAFLRLAVVAAVAFVILSVCSTCEEKSVDPPPLKHVSGYVIDSITAEPIESAMVSVHDTSGVTTYSDGTGYFEGVTIWTVTAVFARKEGYETKWIVRDLTKDTTDRLFFQLVPNNNQ